jgi:hypothetical protein
MSNLEGRTKYELNLKVPCFLTRNEIGPPWSCTIWKKGISFLRGRIPWLIPEVMNKFPVPTWNKGLHEEQWWCIETSSLRTYPMYDTTSSRFQHIYHDAAPLFMCQGLSGRYTCASELPSEKAKVWFIFVSIVTRGRIMHARKVLGVIFFYEVWHLQNVCLCNGSLNFPFISIFFANSL